MATKLDSAAMTMKLLVAVALTLHLQSSQAASLTSQASRVRRQSPTQERLVSVADRSDVDGAHADGELRFESHGEAPFWLKPDSMRRQVYAEVLNSQVINVKSLTV